MWDTGCEASNLIGLWNGYNERILRFDVIPQHDWPIEQDLLHIRGFFDGKTKRLCFDLFIHWLIKQMKNTYRNHFSRSYENFSSCFKNDEI